MLASSIQDFASVVKEMRVKQGLSLRDLGKITGLCYSTVSRLERGEYAPTLDNAARLARALGLDLSPHMRHLPTRSAPSSDDLSSAAVTYVHFKFQRIGSGQRKNISKIAFHYQHVVAVKGVFMLSTYGTNDIQISPGTRINCSHLRSHTYWALTISEVDLFWLGSVRT